MGAYKFVKDLGVGVKKFRIVLLREMFKVCTVTKRGVSSPWTVGKPAKHH